MAHIDLLVIWDEKNSSSSRMGYDDDCVSPFQIPRMATWSGPFVHHRLRRQKKKKGKGKKARWSCSQYYVMCFMDPVSDMAPNPPHTRNYNVTMCFGTAARVHSCKDCGVSRTGKRKNYPPQLRKRPRRLSPPP